MKEQIAELIKNHPLEVIWGINDDKEVEAIQKRNRDSLASAILKLIKENRYVKLDPDQNTPNYGWGQTGYPSISQVQDDMLKTNFRKVILEKETK